MNCLSLRFESDFLVYVSGSSCLILIVCRFDRDVRLSWSRQMTLLRLMIPSWAGGFSLVALDDGLVCGQFHTFWEASSWIGGPYRRFRCLGLPILWAAGSDARRFLRIQQRRACSRGWRLSFWRMQLLGFWRGQCRSVGRSQLMPWPRYSWARPNRCAWSKPAYWSQPTATEQA